MASASRSRRRTGRDTASVRADVDLDQYRDRHAGGDRGGADLADDVRIVGEHGDRGLLRHGGEARELRRADDLVGDEHVAYAGGDEGFGFADLLAADADGAALDLRERDVRAFVRLAVRAQRDGGAADRIRHQVEIALERVEIDDERRRVDVARRSRRGARARSASRVVYFGAIAASAAASWP